jgi:hypothetical protein
MNRIASQEPQPAPYSRNFINPTRVKRLAWAAVLVLVFGMGYLTSRLGTGDQQNPQDHGNGSLAMLDSALAERSQTAVPTPSDGLRIVRLVYAPQIPEVRDVAIAGTFNGWNPELTPMQREGNIWTALLILPPDTYEYMIVEDGDRWITDPLALHTRDDGFGRENAVLDLTL